MIEHSKLVELIEKALDKINDCGSDLGYDENKALDDASKLLRQALDGLRGQ